MKCKVVAGAKRKKTDQVEDSKAPPVDVEGKVVEVLDPRENAFGKDPGMYRHVEGHPIAVRYSKKKNRMQCTAWIGYRTARWGRPAKEAHQCGSWSEPYRDKCSKHGGRLLDRLRDSGKLVSGDPSKYRIDILGDRGVDGFGDKDLEPLDLKPEILHLRKLMKYAMQMMEETTTKEKRLPMDHEVKRIAELSGRISTLQMNQMKLEQHRRKTGGSEGIPLVEVDRMIQGMVGVLQRNIHDGVLMDTIVKEFRDVCRSDEESEPADVEGTGTGELEV